MAHKVTGKILETETSWGVPNVVVEVWDQDERGSDDRLGSSVTLPDGSFAILFREEDFQEAFLDRKPDLYLLVKKPDGTLLHSTEYDVREEAGRRESFVIQIPRERLGELVPKEGVTLEDVARGVDLLSIEEEEFVEEAIGQERTSRRRALLTTTAVVLVAVAFVAWRFLWASESRVANRIFDKWGPAVVQIKTPDETGSGVIFDRDGHILTNYHVIDDGGPYDIRLGSGRTVQGEVIGFDPSTDLAIVKVDAAPAELIVAPRGDVNGVKVGDLSIAIGNPLGLERTLTVGHIGQINRSLETSDPFGAVIDGVIQTDASINPGSSGGALFNANGEVVGINTQIVTVGGGSIGLGFAVPIDLAEDIARELIANRTVRRPFLGVKGSTTPSGQGVQVDLIAGRSAAEAAGLQVGDVILAVGQQPVTYPADLTRVMDKFAIGNTVEVVVSRNEQQLTIPVVSQARPEPGQDVRIVHVESPADASDPSQEWVEIENQGFRTVNLAGYTLRDSQGDAYVLPDFSLSPLRRVRVYTGPGTDDDTALYLNASAPVWQQADSAELLDQNGNEVDQLRF
ncbi:MAG: trypsin-like peptidase domain-containing protein [Anaerolineae bacterium]